MILQVQHWKLTKNDHLLDVGCAKGFMLYDFFKSIEGINLTGIDISEFTSEIANSWILLL